MCGWIALTLDGRSVTGLLISRTPEHMMIRGADGVDVPIAVAHFDELVRQPVSLMPTDLTAAMSADDLVNLVAWLQTLTADTAQP